MNTDFSKFQLTSWLSDECLWVQQLEEKVVSVTAKVAIGLATVAAAATMVFSSPVVPTETDARPLSYIMDGELAPKTDELALLTEKLKNGTWLNHNFGFSEELTKLAAEIAVSNDSHDKVAQDWAEKLVSSQFA